MIWGMQMRELQEVLWEDIGTKIYSLLRRGELLSIQELLLDGDNVGPHYKNVLTLLASLHEAEPIAPETITHDAATSEQVPSTDEATIGQAQFNTHKDGLSEPHQQDDEDEISYNDFEGLDIGGPNAQGTLPSQFT
ncbi:uncharacterized protein A4U43_C04F27600 [Asparagus officinalis]|uniref:Uncharacterized protein n=1 Tax=Asparagus officinalis TaxID=4686 RepID=A0A5P1F4U4_ASPOF|nr:uncharacterized protein A4U43_C04F27600 [Asparagus officinalis]